MLVSDRWMWQLCNGIDGLFGCVLVGLNNGAVLAVSKMMLDARRTINIPQGQRFVMSVSPPILINWILENFDGKLIHLA